MRQVKRLILAIFLLLTLTFILLGSDAIDYLCYWTSGAKEAQQDIQKGHLELRGYGLPARCIPDFARLLKNRLGVKYVSVAGCSVSRPLQKHTNEYNQIMTREIERRFGTSVLEGLLDEARQKHATTKPAA